MVDQNLNDETNAAAGQALDAAAGAPVAGLGAADAQGQQELSASDQGSVAAVAGIASVLPQLGDVIAAGEAMTGPQFDVGTGVGSTTPAPLDATEGQPSSAGVGTVTGLPAPSAKATLPATKAQPATSEAQIIVDAGAAVAKASKDLGYSLTPLTVALVLSQVMHESNFGRTGTLGGTNNWGAFQVGRYSASSPTGKCAFISSFAKAHATDPGFGGTAHKDSVPATGGASGYNFVGFYRVFPTQYAAAKDFLSSWVGRLNLQSSPPSSALDYSTRAYLQGYFGGTVGGARPVGQRSAPFNDAETANIAAYANRMNACLGTVQAALASSVTPRDPTTIDIGPFPPLAERLSAGSGAKGDAMAAQAAKWFPPGSGYGDYAALLPTNGLAWVNAPPPGYNPDGSASGLGSILGGGGGSVIATALRWAGGLLVLGGVALGVFHLAARGGVSR